MDPIKDFVKFAFDQGMGKEAVPAWMTSPAAKAVGTAAGIAIATPIAGAAVGGIGDLAGMAYNAITKKRDFNQMLEFNQDLRQMHKQDPKMVNAAFSTLRRINPKYSRDPLVAGAFVRNLNEAPEGAFNAANTAASARMPETMMQQGYMGNIGKGTEMGMKHLTDVPRDDPTQDYARKMQLAREQRRMQIETDPKAYRGRGVGNVSMKPEYSHALGRLG